MSLLAHIVDWLVPFICGGVATVLGLMWRWGKAMVKRPARVSLLLPVGGPAPGNGHPSN